MKVYKININRRSNSRYKSFRKLRIKRNYKKKLQETKEKWILKRIKIDLNKNCLKIPRTQ